MVFILFIFIQIKENFQSVSAEERRMYESQEVDYLESMDDNGLVTLSVSIIKKLNIYK